MDKNDWWFELASILHMVRRLPLADELVDDDDQTEDEAGVKSSKSDRLKRCRLVAAFTAGTVVEIHIVIANLQVGLHQENKQF